MNLDKFFGLLREGAEDQKNRYVVLEILEALKHGLSGRAPDSVVDRGGEKIDAIYDLSSFDRPEKLAPYFDRTIFVVQKHPSAGGGSHVKTSDGHKVYLRIKVPQRRTVDEWELMAQSGASRWVEKYKKTVFHEFKHVFDAERHIDPKYAEAGTVPPGGLENAPPEKKAQYYNHPRETNAYIQEFIENVEREIEYTYATWEEVQAAYGFRDPTGFIEVMERRLEDEKPEFYGLLYKNNRRGLVKRLLQFHNDLKKYFDSPNH